MNLCKLSLDVSIYFWIIWRNQGTKALATWQRPRLFLPHCNIPRRLCAAWLSSLWAKVGVRFFFYVWCEQTLISHLSGYPKPPSKECPLLGPLLEPPGPKIDQKRVQIAQKRPKSDFEGSGGPKRLEQRGTKLERGTGHKCWDFQTNWEFGGDPNFGPGAPKKGPNCPKTTKILFWGF